MMVNFNNHFLIQNTQAMKQKISIFTALLFLVFFSANAINPSNKSIIATNPTSIDFSNFEKGITVNGKSLTNITPNDIQKLTGKKLSLKEVIKLKVAQKILNANTNNSSGTRYSKGVFILVAIFGFGWLLMGIHDDFSGSTWIVNLILTLICWLPGLIHSLIHMEEYAD
jgi:uncharacterized membrane protein YqaE (UPF0057 family)